MLFFTYLKCIQNYLPQDIKKLTLPWIIVLWIGSLGRPNDITGNPFEVIAKMAAVASNGIQRIRFFGMTLILVGWPFIPTIIDRVNPITPTIASMVLGYMVATTPIGMYRCVVKRFIAPIMEKISPSVSSGIDIETLALQKLGGVYVETPRDALWNTFVWDYCQKHGHFLRGYVDGLASYLRQSSIDATYKQWLYMAQSDITILLMAQDHLLKRTLFRYVFGGILLCSFIIPVLLHTTQIGGILDGIVLGIGGLVLQQYLFSYYRSRGPLRFYDVMNTRMNNGDLLHDLSLYPDSSVFEKGVDDKS